MVAHILKRKNPTAKIIVLDPKEKFSKQGLFVEGWQKHYPDIGGVDSRVNFRWCSEHQHGHNGNRNRHRPRSRPMPHPWYQRRKQVPSVIVRESPTATGVQSYPPPCSRVPTKTSMYWATRLLPQRCPSQVFSANSQAKVAANAIRGALTGSRVFPAPFCQHMLEPH